MHLSGIGQSNIPGGFCCDVRETSRYVKKNGILAVK